MMRVECEGTRVEAGIPKGGAAEAEAVQPGPIRARIRPDTVVALRGYAISGHSPMPDSLKVLIVDDSDIVRERVATQVSEVPRVELVGLAADGPTAMHLFQERHPDVVVLDIELPGTSGFELLTQIKRQRPACVVIMLSNYASGSFRLGCNRLGADFFFNKSHEFERITEVLAAILSAQTSPV